MLHEEKCSAWNRRAWLGSLLFGLVSSGLQEKPNSRVSVPPGAMCSDARCGTGDPWAHQTPKRWEQPANS